MFNVSQARAVFGGKGKAVRKVSFVAEYF